MLLPAGMLVWCGGAPFATQYLFSRRQNDDIELSESGLGDLKLSCLLYSIDVSAGLPVPYAAGVRTGLTIAPAAPPLLGAGYGLVEPSGKRGPDGVKKIVGRSFVGR